MVGGPTRRALLARAAAVAGAAFAPAGWTTAFARSRLPETPFRLGVASGEPLPDGVVLWTRLAPDPQALDWGMPGEPVEVSWEIAEDEGFRRIARRGSSIAAPEVGHAVHIEADGLRPDRRYFYRFMAGGYESPVGRTRTAPAFDADPTRLRIAFASCQKWESGYYAAHAALAQDDPDLVLFLGDYIYEKAASTGDIVRLHPSMPAQDLASYRHRYAWYKSDPDLQAAHAAAPWMVMWDDHEVSNDYGDDQDRTNPDPKAFLARRAAAYQAYWENMPLRRSALPRGPAMQLYRALDWGRLARLAIVDDRQYRNRRTCDAMSDGKLIPADCPARAEASRSLLGREQEAWLTDRLRDTPARWNLLGQQTLMGEARTPDGRVSNDGWDGFTQTRRRVLETWRDHKVANPVVLGGDVHTFFAGDLALEPGARPVASEFVGGSISSLGRSAQSVRMLMASNPHVKFGDGDVRGYGLAEITPQDCQVTFRAVENALVRGSPIGDLARFAVEAGQTGLQRA
ncbi:MAG: alkaline phosphatase D family protein [Pseudomonadota bacterium]